MNARWSLRGGLIALGLIAMAGMIPSAQVTDAAFVDSRTVRTTVISAQLASPMIAAVSSCAVLSEAGVALTWSFPAGNDAGTYIDFTPEENVQWSFDDGGTWTSVTTATVSAGVYRTTFNVETVANLPTDRVVTFAVRSTAGQHWVSQTPSTVAYTPPVAPGSSPTCSAPINGQ